MSSALFLQRLPSVFVSKTGSTIKALNMKPFERRQRSVAVDGKLW